MPHRTTQEHKVVPLFQLSQTDREAMDDATRDIYAACRTAFLLLNDTRRKLGLSPLPPPG